MIEFAKLLRTQLGQNVRTVLAHIASFGMEGDEPNAEQAEKCEALHPVGFVSRATKDSPTAEAVIVRDGDEVHVLFFLDKTDTLHDCEEGEAQLYAPKEPTCRIRMRISGDIEITAKSGQNVIINGGSTPVAKEGSKIDEHYHTLSLAAAYAGPFPVVGFTDNLGASRTLPISPAAASSVAITAGTGSPTIKVP